jgi:transcriptional regulator with XRE-family HTH domain
VSTDFQQARVVLGVRLLELRTEAGLSGRALAALLGWPQSKVSKLETGKQTPTAADMDAWATATGHPDDAAELKGRLLGLETTYRSWKRQLAGGHRAVQEANIIQERQAQSIRLFEPAIIPGIFQTSEYARNVLTDVSERLGSPRDIEAGVRARMKRQDTLYQPNHHFHALVWEAALLTVRCSVGGMIAQLERLIGLMDLSSVTLGVIPLGVRTKFSPKHGFWIIDDALVVADTWNAEMWLDTSDELSLYTKIWTVLDEAAVYGRPAQRLIARAKSMIEAP